jgi:hypothetical protein
MPTIEAIEARARPTGSVSAYIDYLKVAAANTTHVLPSYTIMAKPMGNRILDWVRRLLVEEVYARARVVFPDQVQALHPTEDA